MYRAAPKSALRTNLALGLSAAPTPALCTETLALVYRADDTEDWAAAVLSMLQLNRACRSVAWAAALAQAEQSWAQGCGFVAIVFYAVVVVFHTELALFIAQFV
jgi:hypothetical protein